MNIEVRHTDGTSLDRDPRPIVTLPRRGIPTGMIAAIGIVAGILLFLNLQTQQQGEPTAADTPAAVYSPPPPLSIPTDAIAGPRTVPLVTAAPVVRSPPSTPVPAQQEAQTPMPPPEPMPPFSIPQRPIGIPTPVLRQPVSAAPALVIDTATGEMPVGTLIPAVLETPIDTSRPGQARAIVSHDVRGVNGDKLLVARGSRLIGEYQSDVRSGQDRVLVNWTRLIRPDGTAIRLGLPSSDATGGAGIPGRRHSFFLARFFNAALQTALSFGGNLAGGGAGNTVIVGLPSASAAGQGLVSTDNHRPKITVRPGTLFNVFVARDVDFSAATAVQ